MRAGKAVIHVEAKLCVPEIGGIIQGHVTRMLRHLERIEPRQVERRRQRVVDINKVNGIGIGIGAGHRQAVRNPDRGFDFDTLDLEGIQTVQRAGQRRIGGRLFLDRELATINVVLVKRNVEQHPIVEEAPLHAKLESLDLFSAIGREGRRTHVHTTRTVARGIAEVGIDLVGEVILDDKGRIPALFAEQAERRQRATGQGFRKRRRGKRLDVGPLGNLAVIGVTDACGQLQAIDGVGSLGIYAIGIRFRILFRSGRLADQKAAAPGKAGRGNAQTRQVQAGT